MQQYNVLLEVRGMSNQKIEDLMRDFVGALSEGNVEKVLSFFAEDATYETPFGTFKGKAALRRYLAWLAENNSDVTVNDSGLGIMVQGDKAVYEHVIGGFSRGSRWEVLALCAYEFSGDRIQHLRTVFDRLSVAKQVARGLIARRAVGSIVKRMGKGLG